MCNVCMTVRTREAAQVVFVFMETITRATREASGFRNRNIIDVFKRVFGVHVVQVYASVWRTKTAETETKIETEQHTQGN